MLLDKIENAKIEKLSMASAIVILVWVLMPIPVMLCNVLGIHGATTYKIWMSVMFLIGGIGLAVGDIYLYQIISRSNKSTKEILFALLPFLTLLFFGVWCLIAALSAKYVYVALFGFSVMRDCVTTYIAYAGFILLGLVLSTNKKWMKLVANIFLIMSGVLAIIAIMDNGLTVKLCENYYTNCFHYESIFYNTNHYAYYLVMNILLAGYMSIYEKNIKLKIAYLVSYVVFIVTLVLNNTMGGYLAVFLTLVLSIIWSFINKEDNKKQLFIVFAVFVATSLIMSIFLDTIITNFVMMFSDFGTMVSSIDAESVDADSIGSGRGALWKLYIEVMLKYPILGVGSENIGSNAHNMFLQLGAYNGIVGVSIYISVFVIGAIRLIKIRKEITAFQKVTAYTVVGYLISGFFGVSMFYTSPYFYVILGVCFSGALKGLPYEKDS